MRAPSLKVSSYADHIVRSKGVKVMKDKQQLAITVSATLRGRDVIIPLCLSSTVWKSLI